MAENLLAVRRNGAPSMRGLLLLVALLIAGLIPAATAHGEDVSREYQIKAAFIYNFVQFTEWPPETFSEEKAPIAVGIIGQDPFRGALDQAIKDKAVGGHPLVLRRLGAATEARNCHVLFVSLSEAGRVSSILSQASGSVLTIGENDGFLQAGGIIRMFKEDNKVRFEVNVKAAERAHVKISAKLLKLARIYEE